MRLMWHTRGSAVWGCRVSVGTKRPLTKARVTGRPKDGASLAVGSPGVFHVQLCSRRCIITELACASTITSLPIDRALIRRIAAAEAAEIGNPVWACLLFPGFPSRHTSRLNRNLGIRNDRVSDARASLGCRALLFRIRGSVLDVEQVSQSSCLRVSARERIRQVNLCHSDPARPRKCSGAPTRGAVLQLATGDRVGQVTKLHPSASLDHASRASHAPVFCDLTICAEQRRRGSPPSALR